MALANCVYCGRPDPDTLDHVPPACLYPKPRPENLVTVPSCSACNQGASKDDEYFRLVMVIRRDVGDKPLTRTLVEAVHRGLEKPTKLGMLRALRRTVRPFNLRSPAGLHLGRVWGYEVDVHRLSRVANRIIRGLFFREFGRALPTTHEVRSYAESGIGEIGPDLRSVISETVSILLGTSPRIIGEGIFDYRFQATAEDPNSSAWLMRCYEVESFLCFTAPTRK